MKTEVLWNYDQASVIYYCLIHTGYGTYVYHSRDTIGVGHVNKGTHLVILESSKMIQPIWLILPPQHIISVLLEQDLCYSGPMYKQDLWPKLCRNTL